MSICRRAEDFCRREGFPLAGHRVLCAVSGGVDSMTLLYLLWQGSHGGGYTLTAATFDHRLRPSSAEDAAFVVRWCEERGIPCMAGSGDVAEFARESGQTVEEAARTLRYQFLERTADETGADYIATAHTADDNAETVLLHLLRGSGLNGLGGIPPRRGRIIRPLLEITRGEIEACAARNRIPYREDESNGDTAYTRNYLRHNLLPLLREKNPNLARTLSRTAESLRQDEACLAALTEQAAGLLTQDGAAVSVPVLELNALPAAIALRLVQQMAERAKPGTVLPHVQRQALLALAEQAHPSSAVSLANGLTGRRSYEVLTVFPQREEAAGFPAVTLRPGETKSLPELGMAFSCRWAICPETAEADTFYLRPDGADRVTIRPRRPGDQIDLARRGHKTLKKWMIEEKVPREARNRLPVIERNGRVAAVVGMGRSEQCMARPGQTALEVTVQRKEREHI